MELPWEATKIRAHFCYKRGVIGIARLGHDYSNKRRQAWTRNLNLL